MQTIVNTVGDGPMNELDESKLTAGVIAICSRPQTNVPHRKESKPIIVTTAKAYLKCFRSFLTWASSTPITGTTDKPLWVRPLRFEQIFRDNRPVFAVAERQAALMAIEGKTEVKTFTVAELVELYRAARKLAHKDAQLFTLLALNCGFANEEIADLKRHEIKLDSDAPYIHRFRGKTERPGENVGYARWPLWTETATLLRDRLQRSPVDTDPESPAILTADGRRLVVDQADYVANRWSVVRELVKDKTGVFPPLSFKYLRKTSATVIQNDLKFGQSVADAFLSHGGRGVIARYTPQDWNRVAEAVAELRKHLAPMFDAETADAQREAERQIDDRKRLDAADAERNRTNAAKAKKAIRRHQKKMAMAVRPTPTAGIDEAARCRFPQTASVHSWIRRL